MDFIIKRNITVAEIRAHDSLRIKTLENMGYTVLIIWEKDYKDNKEEVLTKCITFLKEENK